MTTFPINRNSAFRIRWPNTDEGIIAQTEAWISYESSRNAADQLKDPWMALLQAQLDLAKTARTLAQTGEASRTEASDAFRTKLDTARSLLQRALAFLKFKHANSLAQLEHWGWDVRQSKRGGYTVKMPAKDGDLIRLLEIYVAYEATRGPAQLTDPVLATLEALLVDIHDLDQNRDSSRAQRRTNVFVRGSAAYKLQDLLHSAAIAISRLKYDGDIHPDLANWGYQIVAATPKEEEDVPIDPPTPQG